MTFCHYKRCLGQLKCWHSPSRVWDWTRWRRLTRRWWCLAVTWHTRGPDASQYPVTWSVVLGNSLMYYRRYTREKWSISQLISADHVIWPRDLTAVHAVQLIRTSPFTRLWLARATARGHFRQLQRAIAHCLSWHRCALSMFDYDNYYWFITCN